MLATDEVWRLQNGKDPECRSFQKISEQGHYGSKNPRSQQGFYVCTPSGKFLSSINTNHAPRVLDMMKRGLEKWESSPKADRKLPDEFRPRHRWEDSYPEDGLVLTLFARDLPADGHPQAEPNNRWNQDVIWFSADEARRFLPEDLFAAGAEYSFPELLVQRLVALHLVDTVHGQTTSFTPAEVAGSSLTATLADREGDLFRIKFSGSSLSRSEKTGFRTTRHGVVTNILGEAEFDAAQNRFTKFEFVAVGDRWGRTRFNRSRRHAADGPIGFVVRMSESDAPRIAPAHIYDYRADWVKFPAQGANY